MEFATLDTAAPDLEPTGSHNRGVQSGPRLDVGMTARIGEHSTAVA